MNTGMTLSSTMAADLLRTPVYSGFLGTDGFFEQTYVRVFFSALPCL